MSAAARRRDRRTTPVAHAARAFLPAAVVAAGCADETPPAPSPARATSDAAPRPAAERGAPPATATAPPRPMRLTDVTAETGLDMIMTSGATPSREILEVDGGGLGLIDYDGDGDLDLFVANGATLEDVESGPGSRLFRNDGDLRFTDVTEAAGIDLTRWAMGVAVGDVDGDGHDDLYVACFGPNVLYRNTGDGRFEDVTARAGVGDDRWGTSVAFGDLDDDGDLDLYVVNYVVFDPARPPRRAKYKGVTVMNGPHGLEAQADVLYENLGDGTFRDVTEAAGCAAPAPAYGLNLLIVDFDGDHRLDILVGNDSMANFLFRNLGPDPDGGGPRFEEVGIKTGAASNMDGSNQATMGMAVADVDGNGFPDVFSTNFSSDTNTLHLNSEGRFFDDRTRRFGLGLVSRPYLGWGCGFFDLDHDGAEDLIAFNGHVYPEATVERMDSPYEQTPLLFARDGKRFRRVDAEEAGPWLARAGRDRCAAFGDLDGDGDVDAVVGEVNGSVRVLRNDAASPDRRDWLIVSLRDARAGLGNHRAHGSRIELIHGDTIQRRWLFTGGGFQSSSAPHVHFGVPTGKAGTLTVVWPDGATQTVEDVEPGRHVTVERQ